MNRHQEVWVNGVEYDRVTIYQVGGYWEVILVDVETDEIVEKTVGVDFASS